MTRVGTWMVAAVLLTSAFIAHPAAAQPDSPVTGLGPSGTSLMHGDLGSTDSTGHRGPGRGARLAASSIPGGACAATFVGGDGMPVALCTRFIGTTPPAFAAPSVVLFDPRTAQPLVSRQLTKGGLLGGVYGYLDHRDRVVVADGSGSILFVAHRKTSAVWQVYVDDRIDVARHIPSGDAITGLAPDPDGRIWFATTRGVIGVVDPNGRRTVRTTRLPAGEELGNGLSVRRAGASILTTHALYEMRADAGEAPRVVWRRAYDRGPGRKPGQLTWGSGTTPTYFGPGGDGWVAIVDNADRPRLRVFRSDDGSEVCRMPAFARSGPGTENSPMAWGYSLVIPSTYGYQYPPMAVTGPAIPADASFVGGMTRIDVSPDGCRRVWENADRIATLPKLSRADGLIHALGYGPVVPGLPQQVGPVAYVATDFATGRRVETRQVGTAPLDEPLELTGTIAADGTMWQGTVGRMLKVVPGR
ncbi:two-component regulator propeller domain-containing protein [Gordonia aurantiaca]|uniref:two-component regulator propeller domain-containing protein n=1 Tax=Gordonia sp. B21 TaxID=3151852 RepID=UPI00326618DA